MPTHALITDMNENLGLTAGNALEVAESVEYLLNQHREERLDEVVLALVAEMLVVGGIESERGAARAKAEESISSGRAAEVFSQMVAALGGPADFLENYKAYLSDAPVRKAVYAENSGFVASVDGRKFGNAIIEMGGGRRNIDDELDLSVGFSEVAPVGAEVGADRPLAIVHGPSEDLADIAAHMLREAYAVLPDSVADRPVIYQTLTAD
jgi:thymidine phosphorylase